MRTALVSLAVLALATTACQPSRRDVQLNWTFGASNLSCSAAGVATIEVDIGGEFISPNTFACTDASGGVTTGVDLGRFETGTYEIEVTGYDSSGNPIYQDDSLYTVDKSENPNVFNVDVEPFNTSTQPGGQGDLVIFWTFGGKTCAQANISSVSVTVDGKAVSDENHNTSFPCTQDGTDGIDIGGLDAGSHSVEVDGYVSTTLSYSSTFSGTVQANHDTQLTEDIAAVSVAPTTSTAILSWSFAGMSCAAAEVDTVHIFVDGTDTATLPCTMSGGGDGGQLTGISSGAHSIGISGIRGTGAAAELVYETSGMGTSVQFEAGVASHVIVSAPATSPGTGGATLTFSFPAGGPDCTNMTMSTSVSYTLTSPAGVAMPAAMAVCGGASGNTSIAICNPGASGCGAGNAGLAAGVWSISASATSGATSYTASGPFSVPNDAVGTGTLSFGSP